ncbi:MAG: DUF4852 domain-containing protein [Bacteroidales bacterium]|nr:DUF4852 domain-containing protein [Bacteroidales bacterium]
MEAFIAAVGSVSAQTVYYIDYKTNFGEYNFENQEFDFNPFAEETKIEVLNNLFAGRVETNSGIDLGFVNGTDITGMPVPEEKASFWLRCAKIKRPGA